MKTQFAKIPDKEFPHRWARFFHAGTEWLQVYELLKEESIKKDVRIIALYVYSYALGIATELFVKSIVARKDPSFNPKRFNHNTADLINAYSSNIPILDTIAKNNKLMELIKSYEDTVDTKFGDTTISIEGKDEQMVLDNVYKIRAEMCKITGLR